MEVKIIEQYGKPQILINDQEFSPLAFRSFRPEEYNIGGFYHSGVRLMSILMTGLQCTLAVPYSNFGEIWTGPGKYDFSAIDRQMKLFLDNAPDAYFNIMLQLDTREWYLREHPDYSNTFFNLVEMAGDPKWREDVLEYLHAVIGYIEEKYGEKVFCYSLFCGGSTEWYTNSQSFGNPEGEIRQTNKRKRDLFQKYTGDNERELPTNEMLHHTSEGIFRDPTLDSDALSYWKFHHNIIGETILYFAKEIKAFLNRKKLIGLFYGYIFELTDERLLYEGQMGYEQVWKSPDIDMIFAPAAYGETRSVRGPSGFLHAVDADSDSADSAKGEEPIKLTWYVGGYGPQADTESVESAINQYVKDNYGMNIDLDIIENDFGSYDQKMQMVIASQEEFDMCFTSAWTNNIYTNINKNAFLELEELVDQYAPELKESMPEYAWDAATVNGHIYAVPNQQIWVNQNCVGITEEYLDKYDFDISTVEKLSDLNSFMEQCKADNPLLYPMGMDKRGGLQFVREYLGYVELVGSELPGAVLVDDESLTAINQYELPQMMEYFETTREWNQKGYIRPDAATITDPIEDKKNGITFVKVAQVLKPDEIGAPDAKYGNRVLEYQPLTDKYVSTASLTSTMTAISRTSKHPEVAMQFLNYVNTDPELYNLIIFGIEGKHYTRNGNYAEPIENSGYSLNQDWMYGNQFNGLLRPGQPENAWEETKKLNETATPVTTMGFVFDSTPVQTQMATVSAVKSEYLTLLATGSVDPAEKLPEMLEKMKAAGSDEIIAELQSQLDAWKAAQ